MRGFWCWLTVCLVVAVPRMGAAQSKQVVALQKASPSYRWSFPRDHGSHPTFQTEWWYYTGQLYSAGKTPFQDPADFGFQLTFFRRADASGGQLFLAHAALSDFTTKEFIHERRFAPGGTGLAGSAEDDLHTWLRSWDVEKIGDSQVLRFDLNVRDEPIEIRLIGVPSTAPILHGENGYSTKGTCQGCASQYYSLPRIVLNGDLQRGKAGSIVPLAGVAWMDHEFMSNALEPNQAGWDWYSLMLKDGRSLMLFEIRDLQGVTVFRSGTVLDGSKVRKLGEADFTIEKKNFWQSSKSAGRYPVEWQIRIPSIDVDLPLRARLKDQELLASDKDGISYWEGAVSSIEGQEVIGYVEMTGYDRPIGGKL